MGRNHTDALAERLDRIGVRLTGQMGHRVWLGDDYGGPYGSADLGDVLAALDQAEQCAGTVADRFARFHSRIRFVSRGSLEDHEDASELVAAYLAADSDRDMRHCARLAIDMSEYAQSIVDATYSGLCAWLVVNYG